MYAIIHTEGDNVIRTLSVNRDRETAMRCAMDYALDTGVIDANDKEFVATVRNEFEHSNLIRSLAPSEHRVTLCRVLEYGHVK